ncbi:PTS sugar transporter subunit IIA [Thermoanaerobacter uzonensis]|uniref:PTS sugar transporter subunit IIA n=1 Tax=Thermoanaerobacter uzonensis TaxID=447593 RepID=UPI003D766F5A
MIKDLTNENLIMLDFRAKTKEEVLNYMIGMLYENGVINSKELFAKDVFARENLGTTGVGMGIAIPHGKSKAVLKESIAILKLKKPIEWESLDGNPVSMVIMLAVPEKNADTVHLKLLSRLAYFLMDDVFRDELMNAKDKKEILKLIEKKELEVA